MSQRLIHLAFLAVVHMSPNVIVNTALVARVEALEAENKQLHRQLLTVNPFD